jgi:hypothetical protein
MDPAMIVDESELGQLAALIARLSPGQQQLVAALADGFRGGWSRCSGSGPGGAATRTTTLCSATRAPGSLAARDAMAASSFTSTDMPPGRRAAPVSRRPVAAATAAPGCLATAARQR